jgi:uncharacterized protein (TIGR01244 family)
MRKTALLFHVYVVSFSLTLGCGKSSKSDSNVETPQGATKIEIKNAREYEGTLVGGQPTDEQLRQAAKAGYSKVINLRSKQEGPPEEAPLLAELGVSYVSIPVSKIDDLDRTAVEKFDAELSSAKGKVLVHCASGNRVGAAFALRAFWLQGKSPDEALAIGKQAGLTSLEEAVRAVLEAPQAGGETAPAGEGSGELADVTAVKASDKDGAVHFSVTIKSADTGCKQYADWWEVLTPEGKLLYRRILGHSHKDEQPFERSGGPVPVKPDDTVIVRAHMNPAGYGGKAMRGSSADGFAEAPEVDANFAAALASEAPLPEGCAF